MDRMGAMTGLFVLRGAKAVRLSGVDGCEFLGRSCIGLAGLLSTGVVARAPGVDNKARVGNAVDADSFCTNDACEW